MTITASDRIAFAEIDELLKILDEKLVNKIPESMRRVYKNNRGNDYKVQLDINKPIHEQNLSRKAIAYLTELYLKYWVSNDERNNIINKLKTNDEKLSKKLEEEYNLENFLKKNYAKDKKEESTECISLVHPKKENFIQKMFSKLKSFFKK